MADISKEIELGVGLGKLRFGMTPQMVIDLLGEPDDKEREEYSKDDPDFFTEEWHYDELELSISFDMVMEMELSTISVSSPSYTLEGKTLIGMDRKTVDAELKAMDINNQWEEFKEIDDDSDLLSNENEGLSLWYEKGKLKEIQWEML